MTDGFHCDSQLSLRLWFAALAFHEMELATPHPGASKHGLQYDGRPDWRCGCGCGM